MAEKTEGLYGETQNLKAQNIRFVITTIVVAVVILGIAVWGIIYAVSGGRKSEADTAKTQETTSEEVASEDTAEDASEDNVIEVTNLKEDTASDAAEAEAVETAVVTTTTSENIPKTGPEDVLPVALVAGALVAFAGSVKLAKSEA